MKQNIQNIHQYKNFTVVHELRQRIRVIAPCLKHDQERAYILEILLRKRSAIETVRIVPDIASIMIIFNSTQLPKSNLLKLLDAVLGNIGRKPNDTIHKIKQHTIKKSAQHKAFNFAIGDMSCSSCALFLEMVLNRNPDIWQANVNFATQSASVTTRLSKQELFSFVKSQGYTAFPIDTVLQRRMLIDRERKQISIARNQFILAGILSLPVLTISLTRTTSGLLRLLQALLTTVVVFQNGKPFFTKAYKLAKEKTANMDSLIALGVGSAYSYSIPAAIKRSQHVYFDAAAGIIFFVLLGRYLEENAIGKAKEEIRKLVEMQPQTANLIHNDQEITIGCDDITIGDTLLIRPGEKIPTDGVVIKGISSVDESMVTGYHIPVIKEPGHLLTGGCVNGSGALEMRATAVGANTVLSGILHRIDQAQTSKLEIQRTVDKFSAWLIPVVFGIAGLTFSTWIAKGARLPHAFSNAITVLLISCPCALGLATPAATMVSTGQAARRGIYIRDSKSLETAAAISAIVFDKTGTITIGNATVIDFINVSRFGDEKILEFAASAEFNSEHFLGKAILAYARANQIKTVDVSHFHSLPDQGIRARIGKHEILMGNETWLCEKNIDLNKLSTMAQQLAEEGKTPVFMAINGKQSALFGISDQIRADAYHAIERLHDKGVKTLIITGDIEQPAQHVAKQVHINTVIAQASSAKKLEMICQLQDRGYQVAMIGDGINDAPALAAADVGIAIGSGTDIAIETADLILLNGDLNKVADTIELSEKTLAIIKQNLVWAFSYNIIAIPFAAAGKLNPLLGSAAMSLSSVLVIINSLRLFRK